MTILNLASIKLGADTRSLLKDVRQEAEALAGVGDFSPEVKEEIHKAFLPDRISDTLNIEGIHVNPRITRAVLEGQALSEADRYNEKAILSIVEANDFITQLGGDSQQLTGKVIRSVHELVLSGHPESGAFRTKFVQITGAEHQPPDWSDVPPLVSSLCEQFEQNFSEHDPILMACWLHASFTRIHPFVDGNGRVGRLLQDYTLIRASLLPVGVPSSRRREYYDALQSSDGGDWSDLVALIANSELTALDKARRIGEAPMRRRQRVMNLVRKAKSTLRQKEYNLYELWRRRIESVRDEFARWTEDLNEESDDFYFRLRTWDPISYDKWSIVRKRGWARGTWVFTLDAFVKRKQAFAILFYARRHEFSYVLTSEEIDHGTVALFATGAEATDFDYDFGRFKDPYIRFRELLFDGSELVVFRDPNVAGEEADPGIEGVNLSLSSGDKWREDRESQIGEVVEELFLDLLTKLGLVDQ